MEEYPLAYDDIAACQLLGGKDVRKSGMIRKKSGGFKIPLIQSKYDLRFVIIKKGWVYYYEEKTSKKPQNKFSLQGFSNRVINAEEEQTIMPYAFKIYPMAANTRTWYFACENQQEMHDWMESFRLEIEQYNNRGSNLSRQSRSCPNNPVRSFSPHIGTNNRPQSINNPNINARPAPQSTGYFPSQSDMSMTSGIGSSTSSLEPPDDFYEPTEQDPGEFSTDSEEDYENTVYYDPPPEPEESTSQMHAHHKDVGFNPPMRQPFTPGFGSHDRNPYSGETRVQGVGFINELERKLPGTQAYEKPQQPSPHPMTTPSHLPYKPYSKQTDTKPRNEGYGFASPSNSRPHSYAHAAEPTYSGRNLPLPKRPVSSAGIGDAFMSKPISSKSPPSPPTHAAPKLPGKSYEKESQYPALTPATSNQPKPDLPRQRFHLIPISGTPINQNQRRSSEATISEEEPLTFAQKRQSMPIVPTLTNELAQKLGARLFAPDSAPALPHRDYVKKPTQQSFGRGVEAEQRVSSPTHQFPTQLHSPPMRSPKPLPAVPEFPSRPPPLPPTDTKRDNFNFDQQGRKTDASRFPFTSPKPHAQSFDQFSPLPNRYPNESRFTTTPTLPPKPTNAGKGFSRQHVNNGGDYASNYDDTGRNVVLDQEEPGVYDNMKEYDEDTDLLYENDNNCVEHSIAEEQGQSPTEMRHVSNWQANKGHSENQRPTWCDRETQRGYVERTQFSNEVHHVEKPLGIESPKVQNWQANQVHLQNAKAQWPAKEALQEDSKPDWLKALLKPTAAPKPAFQPKNNPLVQKRDTGPISPPEKKISVIGSQTQPSQPWQKSKSLDSQNQAKPPVALKPKPNVNAKPATLQRPVAPSTNFPPQSAADKKPLPPAKPKSNVPSAPTPASNIAAMRRKFE